MRKILISFLSVILLALLVATIVKGIHIGNFNILSISEIKTERENLGKSLQNLRTLTATKYPSTIEQLNNNAKTLLQKKEEYSNLVFFSSDEEIRQANSYENYEMEYLWSKIGNHATKHGVVLDFKVMNNSTGGTSSVGNLKYYDLNFVVTGAYVPITDFISAIENDQSLGFRIENFKLIPNGNNNSLQGSFTVRDVAINIDNISQQNESVTDNEKNNNRTNEKNTNTLNSNNTTNQTNTTSQQ